MRIGLTNKLPQITTLYRGLALLLFILIFVDIASLDVCCEELKDLSGSQASYANLQLSNKSQHVVINANHSQKDKHHKSSNNNDGCFCCCAHFIISNKLTISVPLIEIPPLELIKIMISSAPHQSIFHPPRLA